jgi:peptide/nickel transport system substrate-binding protein
MAMEEGIASLNPYVGGAPGSVVGSMFNWLAQQSAIDGSWVPELADTWEISADGTVYTFRLNPRATWHDGRPVTAHDCVFSMDVTLDERTPGVARQTALEVVDRYRAVDAKTFELVAREPVAVLFEKSIGLMPIIPRHIWEPIPLDEWGTATGTTGEDALQVVGSGPFLFHDWAVDDFVTIARNDAYWEPDLVPRLDRITWKVLPEASATYQAFLAGETDITKVPQSQVRALRETFPEVAITVADENGWTSFTMNGDPQRGLPFADSHVRQAMIYALDRDLIIATLLQGFAVRADGIYPPVLNAYDPERLNTIYDFNPQRARSLLAAAGWVDADADADRVRERDGVPVEVEILFAEEGQNGRQIATYMQQAWRAIGVNAQPASLPFTVIEDRKDTGDFDVVISGWNWFGDDMGHLYRCDAPFNAQRICDPEFDRLNSASMYELDPARRRELLIDQGNIVHDGAHLGWLYFDQVIYAAQPRVRNFFATTHAFSSSFPWIWLDDEA